MLIAELTHSKLMPHVHKYEQRVSIAWHINNVCNYKCIYCCVANIARYKDLPFVSVVADRFNQIGKPLIINISGGEPFLYPQFVDLCKALTRQHYITIQTNLSTKNVYEFADRVDPAKVLFVTASVHILERESRPNGLKRYVEKMLYLQERKFNVLANYVAYPSLLPRMSHDLARLRDAGVLKTEAEPFQGLYGGLHYPRSYSEVEMNTIMSLGADIDAQAILYDVNAYRGHLCTAGVKAFTLDSKGRFYRCNRSKRPYGDLFSSGLRPDIYPRPCPFSRCICPYFGILNVLETRANKAEVVGERMRETACQLSNMAVACIRNPSVSVKKVHARLKQRRWKIF